MHNSLSSFHSEILTVKVTVSLGENIKKKLGFAYLIVRSRGK